MSYFPITNYAQSIHYNPSNNHHYQNQIFHASQSYRINANKFRQQSTRMNSELANSFNEIEKIRRSLQIYTNSSFDNVNTSGAVQSKYYICSIPEDEENESRLSSSQNIQDSEPKFDLNQKYQFGNDLTQQLPYLKTKTQNKFSPFNDYQTQIEDDIIFCVICNQKYLHTQQEAHLQKHKKRFNKPNDLMKNNKISKQSIKAQQKDKQQNEKQKAIFTQQELNLKLEKQGSKLISVVGQYGQKQKLQQKVKNRVQNRMMQNNQLESPPIISIDRNIESIPQKQEIQNSSSDSFIILQREEFIIDKNHSILNYSSRFHVENKLTDQLMNSLQSHSSISEKNSQKSSKPQVKKDSFQIIELVIPKPQKNIANQGLKQEKHNNLKTSSKTLIKIQKPLCLQQSMQICSMNHSVLSKQKELAQNGNKMLCDSFLSQNIQNNQNSFKHSIKKQKCYSINNLHFENQFNNNFKKQKGQNKQFFDSFYQDKKFQEEILSNHATISSRINLSQQRQKSQFSNELMKGSEKGRQKTAKNILAQSQYQKTEYK